MHHVQRQCERLILVYVLSEYLVLHKVKKLSRICKRVLRRPGWLMASSPRSLTCGRPRSSKVLTVQVVRTDLLQFVHFRYCWSPLLVHQPAPKLRRWKTLVALRRVLLVCSQLLPVLAVQIHAKLSVPQTRGQKRRYGVFCFLLFQKLWWTHGALKEKTKSQRAQESRCCLQSC